MAKILTLSPQSVDAYKQLITEPQKHKLPFPSLSDIFEKSEIATPKHILFKEYIQVVNVDVPKIMFYIIMDEIYGASVGIAPSGELGYKLMVKISNIKKGI